MRPTLFAYPPSVYCQIVRMALAEMGIETDLVEVDPFAGTGDNPHPFGRVPMLRDAGFDIYETTAILAYLDAHYAQGRFTPDAPRARARMVQVQGIVDAHAYWPLVRMVYVQSVVAPSMGKSPDQTVLSDGFARANTILAALDDIAKEGLILNGPPTLADFHLAPMIGFFAAAPQGAQALRTYPALSRWIETISSRPAYCDTCPPLVADSAPG